MWQAFAGDSATPLLSRPPMPALLSRLFMPALLSLSLPILSSHPMPALSSPLMLVLLSPPIPTLSSPPVPASSSCSILGQALTHLTFSALRTLKRALSDKPLCCRSTKPSPVRPLCLFPTLGHLSEICDRK